MALRKCPECGNDVSDKANTCPKCGFVLNYEKINTLRSIAHFMVIIGLILIGIAIILSFVNADRRLAVSVGVAPYSELIKYRKIQAIENIVSEVGALLLVIGLIIKIFFKTKKV